jgi:hypothetical protein
LGVTKTWICLLNIMRVELTFAFLENVDSSNVDMDTVVAGLLVCWVLGEQELKQGKGT